MELYDLPDGWEWTTIGDLADVNPSMGFPEHLNGESLVSFVPMAAVDELLGAIVAAQDRPIKEVWKGYKRFATGDVIFARITPCMENGKSAVAIELTNGIGLGSTEFIVIRPEGGISNQWIYRYVRQKSFRDDAVQDMTGTAGQLRVSKEYIERAAIPLAPTAEQHRIIDKIEALFAQSQISRDVLDEIPELVRQFRQSVLAAAFRGDLTERDPNDEPADVLLERIFEARYQRWRDDLITRGKNPHRVEYHAPAAPDTSALPELPEGWRWCRAEQLCDFITKGTTPAANKLYAGTGEIPFLKVYNLTHTGYLDFTVNPTFIDRSTHEGELARSRVFPNDVLMNIVGPPLGKISLVPEQYPEWNVNQAIAIFRALEGYLPKFLMCSLLNIEILDRAARRAKATAGQFNLTLEICRDLPLPLASINEQHRIVEKIESAFAFADTIECAVNIARHNIDQLEQSILQRAFEGRLIPQDPDDETAAELLARIRAVRAKGRTKQPQLPGID